MPANTGYSLVYDPAIGAVLSVGGRNSTGDVAAVMKWSAGAWVAVSSLPLTRLNLQVVWDSDRQKLVAYDGATQNGALQTMRHNVCELGATWQDVTPMVPESSPASAVAYDPVRDLVVRFGGGLPTVPTNDTWTYDTAWHSIAPGAMPTIAVPSLAYDPVRDAVVTASVQDLWAFRDGVWTQIPTAGAPIEALAFDPSQRALVAVGSSHTYVQPSGTLAWTALPPAVSTPDQPTLAFDARSEHVVYVDRSFGRTDELVAGAWKPTLSPGGHGFRAVSDQQRGTVMFIAATGSMWERQGAEWVSHLGLPVPIDGPSIYRSRTGEILVFGTTANVDGNSTFVLHHAYTSQTPIETCESGADTDGDGLAGCDDPDCWWACSKCPPYATCP
jgi:hypothetical protein